ncbi:hypothetical protein O181_059718 [Austropuccinia psidii MF-1]|uniref:Uncharacterized protein n=1 Tax=Austropuccinia psidii MF-1 TaxID=1389203 RepID=A0A9Q3EJC1_9BASI|nr:hypothetical protein [Austropuccinia psidii MF-1]
MNLSKIINLQGFFIQNLLVFSLTAQPTVLRKEGLQKTARRPSVQSSDFSDTDLRPIELPQLVPPQKTDIKEKERPKKPKKINQGQVPLFSEEENDEILIQERYFKMMGIKPSRQSKSKFLEAETPKTHTKQLLPLTSSFLESVFERLRDFWSHFIGEVRSQPGKTLEKASWFVA